MIHLLTDPTFKERYSALLAARSDEVRLAVDVALEIVAAGGEYHHDCELVLLAAGSRQEHVWGATWIPLDNTVRFDAFINIRPRQGNRVPDIIDPTLRELIERIVRMYLEVP